MTTVLTAESITKVYHVDGAPDVLAVHDLTLEIAEGEFVCIIGASGCGKSTLLNMFAGFSRPTSGRILLRGEPITGIEPRCGMVFQSYALFPWKTVRGNVEFGLKMKGVPAAQRRETAEYFIELVKLTGFADRYPTELSGGMQQRVTLARILAADPEVLLMDEPFAALDAQTRDLLQSELLRIWEQINTTVVFVTHAIDEAIYLADRVVVMTARPGLVKEIVEIDLPRPRELDLRNSPEFNHYRQQVWEALRDEVTRAQQDWALSASYAN